MNEILLGHDERLCFSDIDPIESRWNEHILLHRDEAQLILNKAKEDANEVGSLPIVKLHTDRCDNIGHNERFVLVIIKLFIHIVTKVGHWRCPLW
jgi:hypothetical protein